MRTTIFALDAEIFEQKYLYLPNCIPLSQWEAMLARGNDVLNVADLLEELDLSNVLIEGDSVILPKNVTSLIMALCLADCAIAEYQILYTDFFFADLGANPPQTNALSSEAQAAWNTFLKVADINIQFRKYLPWWIDEAADYRCCSTGLLMPTEALQIHACHAELLQLLGDSKDARGLFQIIADASDCGSWVFGLEPGT